MFWWHEVPRLHRHCCQHCCHWQTAIVWTWPPVLERIILTLTASWWDDISIVKVTAKKHSLTGGVNVVFYSLDCRPAMAKSARYTYWSKHLIPSLGHMRNILVQIFLCACHYCSCSHNHLDFFFFLFMGIIALAEIAFKWFMNIFPIKKKQKNNQDVCISITGCVIISCFITTVMY